VTQFKETVAFEDLQRIIGNEIAGVYLARLKEFSVPDDRLRQVAEDICYDIASAMNSVGDFEIPGADQPGGIEEEKTDEIEQSEPDAGDLAFMEETTDKVGQPEPATEDLALLEETTEEFELPELSVDGQSFLVEKTDEIGLKNVKSDDLLLQPVAGVLSQNEILKILDAAKAASV